MPRRKKKLSASPSQTITISKTCPKCGAFFSMDFDKTAYDKGMSAWQQGMTIQEAFPTFTQDQLDFLHVGLCQTCYPILKAN